MWLYNFGLMLYALAIRLVSPRYPKAKLWIEGRKNLFERMADAIDPKARIVWIHVASLGEFEQGRPIIERLRKEYPEYKILLTFFSPSGYEIRKNYSGVDYIFYLPIDTPSNARRFLDIAHPEIAIFVKYEFWINLLTELRHRSVRTYIVSAIFRRNSIFFRPYGSIWRQALESFDTMFVQNEESKSLLAELGFDNVVVAGDTRFDRVIDVCNASRSIPVAEKFAAGSKVLVAGSSWEHDEDIIIPYFNEHPGMKLILAPHVVSDSHIERIKQALKRPAVCITDTDEGNVAEADCLIVNTYGMLSSIYRYGRVAYVGGGFGVGIHNVPEAAVYGVPVIIGPNHRKFREANALLSEGGCMEITSPETFAMTMDLLLGNEERRSRAGAVAGEYIRKNAGASDAIFNAIKW